MKEFVFDKLRALRDIRAEPEAVAGGVAIGMFMGFTPFIGFKTVLALVIAWLARCSKLAAVISVTLHDLLLPIAPVLVWIEFKLGDWVLGMRHHVSPARLQTRSFLESVHNWTSIFNWEFFHNYVYPVLIGSLIIGFPFSILTYYLTHAVLVKMREHRRAVLAMEEAQKTEKAKEPQSH